jgi:hypothetical protein
MILQLTTLDKELEDGFLPAAINLLSKQCS